MNLKNLSDKLLLQEAESVVQEEREILTKVLRYLQEISRRRLYSDLGYKSLFAFTVDHFKYSEDQAYRRIAAMKLLNEMPEIEEKINSGELTLKHLNVAQTFFSQELKVENHFSKEEKLDLMQEISNKSAHQAEVLTKSYASEKKLPIPDRIKVISGDSIELTFAASKELQDKISKLKGLMAHTHPNISLGELFNHLCDLGIKTHEKSAPVRKRRVIKGVSKIQIRRNVFAKAKSQCENCGSGHALEIDHIIPKAKGGSDTPDNLRLLCKSCNQRAAIKVFGINKIAPFLKV